MAFSQIQVAATAQLSDLEKIIQSIESPLLEFVGMFETGHFPSPNVLFFKPQDAPVSLQPVRLEQIDPDIDQDAAVKLVEKRIDEGFAPLPNFFDVNLTGGEVTALVFRGGQPLPLSIDADQWITTNATVFGLNMNGSFDDEDNGMGAPVLGSINTRDPMLVGAAIPIRLVKKIFGSLAGARGKKVEVVHLQNKLTIQAQIVDLGPSEGQVAKGIALDLTLGAQRALGGDGLIAVKFRFV